MRAINVTDLDLLATRLDADGVAVHEDELRAVAARARRAGVATALVTLVGSPTAPEIARLRAFGKVAALLGAAVSAGELAVAS